MIKKACFGYWFIRIFVVKCAPMVDGLWKFDGDLDVKPRTDGSILMVCC